MEERIVCAAVRDSAGVVVPGVRHYDRLMSRANFGANAEGDEQGFLTNRYRFVNRQEAWKIAEANGQILRRVGGDDTDGGTLYSENLY